MNLGARITVLAALVVVPLATFAARADEAPPSVTVTGAGRISAAPDLARITAGVVAEAPHATDAVKQSSASMQKVLAALGAAGIDPKHVQTSRFDVSPIYSESPDRRAAPAISGYRATNQVEVEVHGVEKVGGVLDALVAAGANEIGGISFEIAEPKALEDEARKQAVADARRKAELFAAATGATLGRVLHVDEGGGGGGPVPVYAKMEMAAGAPIAPGQLDVTSNVTISWSLAP